MLRLIRGDDLELVSRELGVSAAGLSGWWDDSLGGGQAALESRPTDDRDDEIARLRAKLGELTGPPAVPQAVQRASVDRAGERKRFQEPLFGPGDLPPG